MKPLSLFAKIRHHKKMNHNDILAIRDAIMGEILADFPQDGWTWENVIRGAEHAGYDKAMACAVFPDGLGQVVAHFADMADRAMFETLEGVNVRSLRTPGKIESAIMARCGFLSRFKEAERAAIAFHALPWRKPQGARILWRTADRIWLWAGDTAQDYNYYTKRGLLCGVLAATALALLGDETAHLSATQGFLKSRLADVAALGGLMALVKTARGGTAA